MKKLWIGIAIVTLSNGTIITPASYATETEERTTKQARYDKKIKLICKPFEPLLELIQQQHSEESDVVHLDVYNQWCKPIWKDLFSYHEKHPLSPEAVEQVAARLIEKFKRFHAPNNQSLNNANPMLFEIVENLERALIVQNHALDPKKLKDCKDIILTTAKDLLKRPNLTREEMLSEFFEDLRYTLDYELLISMLESISTQHDTEHTNTPTRNSLLTIDAAIANIQQPQLHLPLEALEDPNQPKNVSSQTTWVLPAFLQDVTIIPDTVRSLTKKLWNYVASTSPQNEPIDSDLTTLITVNEQPNGYSLISNTPIPDDQTLEYEERAAFARNKIEKILSGILNSKDISDIQKKHLFTQIKNLEQSLLHQHYSEPNSQKFSEELEKLMNNAREEFGKERKQFKIVEGCVQPIFDDLSSRIGTTNLPANQKEIETRKLTSLIGKFVTGALTEGWAEEDVINNGVALRTTYEDQLKKIENKQQLPLVSFGSHNLKRENK